MPFLARLCVAAGVVAAPTACSGGRAARAAARRPVCCPQAKLDATELQERSKEMKVKIKEAEEAEKRVSGGRSRPAE